MNKFSVFQFSKGSAYDRDYGCTGSEGGREAEDKGSDSLWPKKAALFPFE